MSRSISLIAAFFSLVGCVVQVLGTLLQSAPLIVLGGTQYLNVFSGVQLTALALLSSKLYGEATNISLVFFGVYCLLLGLLILRSTFLPRTPGALLVVAGLGWISFLWPPFAGHLRPYNLVLGFMAELSLCLWLLVKGVNEERWRDQTAVGADLA